MAWGNHTIQLGAMPAGFGLWGAGTGHLAAGDKFGWWDFDLEHSSQTAPQNTLSRPPQPQECTHCGQIKASSCVPTIFPANFRLKVTITAILPGGQCCAADTVAGVFELSYTGTDGSFSIYLGPDNPAAVQGWIDSHTGQAPCAGCFNNILLTAKLDAGGPSVDFVSLNGGGACGWTGGPIGDCANFSAMLNPRADANGAPVCRSSFFSCKLESVFV
ncbi:MAG: hypothetical protein HY288_16865 [Planctomycetia bacterium]|nr:hypothetical protein [Planctomycetia bacterium]